MPQDFLFDFLNNADNSFFYKPDTSPLSSFCLTPEILNPPDHSNPDAANHDQQVTQSQQTPNMELFSLLLSANSPEVREPKTYKQAVSKQNLCPNSWKTAMQEEIDSLISNNTWILTQLPSGRIAINGKWVYKIKLELQGKVLQYKAH